MKTKMLFLLLIVVLSGCDLLGIGGSGKNKTVVPVPINPVTYGNIIDAAGVYTYSAPTVDPTTIVDIGEFGTTTSAACYVVWNTVDNLYCGCRNTVDDGQWAQTCTENLDGTVSCSSGTSAASLFVMSSGPARELSPPEVELCDALKNATYCDATRVDGSASPCVPL